MIGINEQKKRPKKRFVLIAKIDSYTFVKYRFNDVANVLDFMLKKYPDLRFINFFYNTGENKGVKWAEYGKHKGLIKL